MVKKMSEKKINSIFNDPLMLNLVEMVGKDRFLGWKPVYDIIEFSDKIVVIIEIPGIERESLNLTYSEKILKISGYKKDINIDVEENIKYVWLERICGEFNLEVEINGLIDVDGIKAEYHNGILKILLPKILEEEKKIYKIPVQWK